MRRWVRRRLNRALKEASESSCAWQRIYIEVRLDGVFPLLSRADTYVVGSIQSEKGVRRELLRPAGKGVADLEEWQDGKALVELSAQAGEGLVGEKHIALHLPSYRINGARVSETERISPCLEGVVCVDNGVHEAICPYWHDKCVCWKNFDLDRDSYFFQRICCRHTVCVHRGLFVGEGGLELTIVQALPGRWIKRMGDDGGGMGGEVAGVCTILLKSPRIMSSRLSQGRRATCSCPRTTNFRGNYLLLLEIDISSSNTLADRRTIPYIGRTFVQVVCVPRTRTQLCNLRLTVAFDFTSSVTLSSATRGTRTRPPPEHIARHLSQDIRLYTRNVALAYCIASKGVLRPEFISF